MEKTNRKKRERNTNMKKCITFCAVALLAGPAAHGALMQLIPVDVSAQHWGDNGPAGNGSLKRIWDESGLTKVGDNPANWTHSNSGNWVDMWAGNTTTGPADGWVVIDLGESFPLDNLFIWNHHQPAHLTNGVADYNLYLATTPTVTVPVASATVTAYDFGSGGWTQFGGTFTLDQGINSTSMLPSGIVDLSGQTARYIGIDIQTSYGGNRAALSELVITQIPEPGTAGLMALFGLAALVRRRVRR